MYNIHYFKSYANFLIYTFLGHPVVDVDFKYVLPKLFQYHWADGNQVKKPIKCSAPKYIDFLMTWVQDQLDDETLFPSKIGVPFPNNFLTNAKTILKRLFRVYAHVYHQHFKVEQDGPSLESSSYLNVTLRYLGPWDPWTFWTLGPLGLLSFSTTSS